MEDAAETVSLLLAPVGGGRLLCDFHARLPSLPSQNLTIAPAFRPTGAYVSLLQSTCRMVTTVAPVHELGDVVATFDPADWVLLADPLCFPSGPIDASPMLGRLANSRSVVHLVAMNANPEGITDRVIFDRRGGVRGIRRYYDARTWSYLTGVVCTLMPAATFIRFADTLDGCSSLTDFRTALAASGVPCRDLPLAGEALRLDREAGLLRVAQRAIARMAVPEPQGTPTALIHPTAKLLGPVAVQQDAVIEADATIIGPAVLGAGSRVGTGAIVAQSLVGAGVEIVPGTTVTHRAVFHAGSLHFGASEHDDRDVRVSTPLTEETGEAESGSVYLVIKEWFDRTAAFAALVCLSPLLLLLAILIKLDSRGPVFYADLRETIGGRQFHCWKFRTMRPGAAGEQWTLAQKNQMDGPQFKINGDPRITRLGRWLRKISLDELPQLFNVLAGEMSLVGPRPSPFRENQICVPWRQARLSVRAGITGLWQVARDERRNGDFHQWIYYDLLYVQHLSWKVDAKILIATVLTFGGAGRVSSTWIVPTRGDLTSDELASTARVGAGAPV
jgi:lipopolysaccharide/colanic/teichoic acid biosynthesis glycosyltransferase